MNAQASGVYETTQNKDRYTIALGIACIELCSGVCCLARDYSTHNHASDRFAEANDLNRCEGLDYEEVFQFYYVLVDTAVLAAA